MRFAGLLIALVLWVLPLAGATLVPAGATWQWQLTESEPEPVLPGIWRETDYEVPAQGWQTGGAPFARGVIGASTPVPSATGGFIARHVFQLPNPGQYSTYRISGAVAGGVVVWLNGVEIWRDLVPEGVESPGGTPVAGDLGLRPFALVRARSDLPSLRGGSNVLAVLVLPGGADKPLYWTAEIEADPDTVAPTTERILPPPGSEAAELSEVEVLFTESVIGVDAGDLMVNGVPAVAVTPLGPDHFVFTVPPVDRKDVRVEFRPDAGITDRSTPPNLYVAQAWSYVVDTNAAVAGVQISEFMADNDRTLRDEDGDESDWIELHNPSSVDVRLKDWGLSDSRSQPAKWRFPDVILPARGFLVVFASEKNRTDPAGRLHTNFKLGAAGEYLGLVDASGAVVSEFAPQYPEQRRDVSYGRAPGSPDTVGFFERPTPGAANAQSGAGFAPGITISRPSGTYAGSIEVGIELAAPDPNAVIRYTVDRTAPGPLSPVYTAPLRFTNAVHLRARAFSPGRLPGPPSSETYVPLSVGAAQFRSDLPVIMIHNFSRGRPSTTGSFASVQLFEPVNGVTSMTNPPTLAARALVGARGSSTEGLPKVSMKVEFRDEFDLDRDLGWLGMPEDSDWVLYGPNLYDPIMIHNPFMHTLSRDLGYYSSRTRFVEVYLVVAGTGAVATTSYNGIYVLEEKIKRGKNRVDVDKLEPEHATEPSVSGGYLFKVDRADPGDAGFNAAGVTMMYVDPKEREIRQTARLAQRQYVTRFYQQFGSALNGANYRHPTLGYAAFLDVEPTVDFHILNTVAFNVDALVLSTYLYKPRGGKLTFGPLWDFDRALGSTDGRDAEPRVWGNNFFSAYWFPRLFSDPDFTQRWVDRYQEMRVGVLTLSNVYARIDRLTVEIRQAQPRERAKWGTSYRGGSYTGEINHMKSWMSNRLSFIDGRFMPALRVDPPVLDPVGGRIQYRLRMPTNANTQVYYTTDGTDPRLSGGAINPTARVYNPASPLTFDRNTRVIARAYSTVARTGTPNSRWGGPSTSVLVVTRPALRFTEIQFNPSGDGDREFLEVFNPGPEMVPLSGWSLAGGIQFRFAGTNQLDRLEPGQRCIVVRDLVAFGPAPVGVLVAGQFEGKLADEGDVVELRGPVGELVDRLAYGENEQPLAAGSGWSLVADSENALDATVWRLSALPGGSPGTPDLASMAGPGGDTDADSLPDVWERRYGLIVGEAASDRGVDDSDGDGVSNAGEFRAGTDPKQAASVIALEGLLEPGGGVRLRWNRVPGRGSVVRVRAGWDGPESVLTIVPPAGTGGTAEAVDPAGAGAGDRFYRLTAE